jgi:hypothetical protein
MCPPPPTRSAPSCSTGPSRVRRAASAWRRLRCAFLVFGRTCRLTRRTLRSSVCAWVGLLGALLPGILLIRHRGYTCGAVGATSCACSFCACCVFSGFGCLGRLAVWGLVCALWAVWCCAASRGPRAAGAARGAYARACGVSCDRRGAGGNEDACPATLGCWAFSRPVYAFAAAAANACSRACCRGSRRPCCFFAPRRRVRWLSRALLCCWRAPSGCDNTGQRAGSHIALNIPAASSRRSRP